ncbi:hypothetical protein DEJ31_13645 [Curtobacterium sp. MCPF17_031]|nr:hypothetical protein DEJ31_13645 [Curtobacterium sp. MCPF17_031]
MRAGFHRVGPGDEGRSGRAGAPRTHDHPDRRRIGRRRARHHGVDRVRHVDRDHGLRLVVLSPGGPGPGRPFPRPRRPAPGCRRAGRLGGRHAPPRQQQVTTGAEQPGVQPGARPAVRRRIRTGRLGAGTLAALTLVGGAVFGLAAPASAHNYVVSATPAANSTLTALPKTFAITTNDRLLDIGDTDSGFAFRIVGPDGKYFEDGCVDVTGPTMSTTAALGASGDYQAEWQIISADGHTVSDSYDFTWKAPAGFTPATGTTKPPTCANAGNGSTAAASTTGTESGEPASAASDALWIGAGGLVVVAAIVAVLLLVRRRPAPAADDADED